MDNSQPYDEQTSDASKRPKSCLRTRCLRTWLAMVGVSVLSLLASYAAMPLRALQAATVLFGLVVAGLYLAAVFAARPWTRYAAVGLVGMLVAWALLADRPHDRDGLRAAYLARLRGFTGTHYLFGGESHLGIDCSGLARVAFIEAMAQEGLREGNPRLLGPRLWRFWWRDMGAQAMGSEAYRYTREVDRTRELATYDHAALQPGDLAIVSGGSHAMVYLGDRQWIEANPDDGRVVINAATPDSPRRYFHAPAVFVRWTALEEGEAL